MKILITGLGVTGKSSFRKILAGQYQRATHKIKIFNLDLDYDRNQLPEKFYKDTIYILEDVHGPTPKAVIPLSVFDQVYYLLPSWYTHLLFWLSRMRIWFENGRFAWDPDIGEKGAWAGTGKPRDWRNIPGILKYFWKHFSKRGRTIKEDFNVIRNSEVPTYIIIPSGKREKMSFTFKPL